MYLSKPVKVTVFNKDTSLLAYTINYSRYNFYDTGLQSHSYEIFR